MSPIMAEVGMKVRLHNKEHIHGEIVGLDNDEITVRLEVGEKEDLPSSMKFVNEEGKAVITESNIYGSWTSPKGG